MNKIKHYLQKVTLTTPAAIIIGSIIISVGLVGYGYVTRGAVAQTISNPLPKILRTIGINKSAFESCVNSGERASIVTASLADGERAGVTGTPSTFVLKEQNGVFYTIANISGAQNKEYFKQAIETALAATDVTKFQKFAGRPVDQNDVVEGTGSNIYVVEYSDSECPFCQRVHPTLKELRTDYANRISFVYRNFPLNSIHPHAQKEAEMISCVGMLGGAKAYYPFIDAIFDFKLQNNIGYIPTGN